MMNIVFAIYVFVILPLAIVEGAFGYGARREAD